MNTKQTKGDHAGHELVDATVILRPLDTRDAKASSRSAVETVLQNAQNQTGLAPERFVVFENINAFSVRAPAEFLEAVGRASEVEHLMADDTGGSALIPPVSRRTVDLEAVTRLTGKTNTPGVDSKGR